MSSAAPEKSGQSKRKFPWLLLLLLVAGIYAFWILPLQLGSRHVALQFENPGAAR